MPSYIYGEYSLRSPWKSFMLHLKPSAIKKRVIVSLLVHGTGIHALPQPQSAGHSF